MHAAKIANMRTFLVLHDSIGACIVRSCHTTRWLSSLVSVLLAAWTAALPAASVAQESATPDLTNEQKLALFSKMRRCTVKVIADIDAKIYHVGSGVAIKRFGDDVLVVTNAHVVSGEDGRGLSPDVKLGTWNASRPLEAKILVSILETDSLFDVALLIAHDPDRHLSIAEMNNGIAAFLKPGTPVYACGNPRGEEFLPTMGKIKAVHDDPSVQEMPTIEHDALVEHGSSGGGLFDSEGKLLGINTYLRDDLRTGIAVPVGYFVGRWPVHEVFVKANEDWQDLGVYIEPTNSVVRPMAIGEWEIDAEGHTADSRGVRQTFSDRVDDRFPYGCLLVRFGDTTDRVGSGLKRSDGKTSPNGVYGSTFFGLIGHEHGRIAFRINIKDNAHCSGWLHVYVLVIPTFHG